MKKTILTMINDFVATNPSGEDAQKIVFEVRCRESMMGWQSNLISAKSVSQVAK